MSVLGRVSVINLLELIEVCLYFEAFVLGDGLAQQEFDVFQFLGEG